MFAFKGNSSRLVVFLLFLFLSVYAGLRDPFSDYESYLDLYNGVSYGQVECGFGAIVDLCRYFNFSSACFFLVVALISLLGKSFFVCEFSPFSFASLVIYYSYYYIYHDLIQIRIGLVVFLYFFIVMLVVKGKRLFSILLIVGALSLHTASVTMFFMIFVKRDRLNKSFWLLFLLFSYVFSIFSLDLVFLLERIPDTFFSKVLLGYVLSTSYGGHPAFINQFNCLQVLRLLFSVLLIVFSDYINKESKYGFFMVKLYVLSVSFYALFSCLPVVSVRISQFYGVIEVFLLPILFSVMFRRNWFYVCLASFLYSFITIYLVVFRLNIFSL